MKVHLGLKHEWVGHTFTWPLCGSYTKVGNWKFTDDPAKVTCRRCLYGIAIRLRKGHHDMTKWHGGQYL